MIRGLTSGSWELREETRKTTVIFFKAQDHKLDGYGGSDLHVDSRQRFRWREEAGREGRESRGYLPGSVRRAVSELWLLIKRERGESGNRDIKKSIKGKKK